MRTNKKYLIFDTANCWPAGLDHKLGTLKSAIKEAILLDRILVLREFAIWPYQNLVHKQNSKVKRSPVSIGDVYISEDMRDGFKYVNFEDYINLAKTEIYELASNRDIKKVEKPLRYIKEEDFDLNTYTDEPELILKTDQLVGEFPKNNPEPINDQVLIMENDQLLTSEQNNQYKVVVRRTNTYGYNRADFPLVILYPSDKVNRLTDSVLKSMATSINDVKKRFDFYHEATATEIQNNYQTEFSKKPLYYACLHVRANDILFFPHIKYAADPCHLKHIVRRAVPKGSIIYAMTDISDPGYFDFLKEDYTVYQYLDFPELKSLISSEDGLEIDNAMLYSVEKNIMQYAHTKIMRTKRQPRLLYINSSYKVPLKYKFSCLYECLLSAIKYPKVYRILYGLIKRLLWRELDHI